MFFYHGDIYPQPFFARYFFYHQTYSVFFSSGGRFSSYSFGAATRFVLGASPRKYEFHASIRDTVNNMRRRVPEGKPFPYELIITEDQQGLKFVPSANTTMVPKGQKIVKLQGTEDKRMCTLEWGITAAGTVKCVQCVLSPL